MAWQRGAMVAARRIIALSVDAEQRLALVEISRSRTEPANRVERARIILAYLQEPSAYAVACAMRVSQQTVTRRAVSGGAAQEPAIAVISYDEKPGIQAIGTLAPDLRPVPGTHPTVSRDHEYKRHGTVTLMAGIDLLTGQVHALVKDRHRSREFIEFLTMLEAAYPAATAIKIILDNHSAHISRETKAWLAAGPEGR